MTHRLALNRFVSREAFQRAATGRRWFLYTVVPSSDGVPYEEVWSIDGGDSAVHYIEDQYLGVPYLMVMGKDEDAIAADLAHDLGTVDANEAVRMVREAKDDAELMRGLEYLAASVPERADPAVVGAIAQALEHPDPDVRRLAIFASTYAAWPELDTLLARTAEVDPDPGVRDGARRALDAILQQRHDT